MDLSSMGITSVASITVICYLLGLVMKATHFDNNQFIPISCGFLGGALGLVALYTGLPNFPATDPLTAVAIGIVSGLAATGFHQTVKQLGSGGK
jgi:hypothetical protein